MAETQVMSAIQRSGQRLTPQRMAIAEVLARSPKQASAQELYDRVRRKHPSIGLAACGSIAPGGGGAIRVVAAENFYGDLTKQIGGDRVQVTSILSDPSIDPHEYESNTQDAVAVARAQLVIENGAGYDSFIDHLMSASPSSLRQVINVARVFAIPSGANPHLWYSPRLLGEVADRIANQLGTIDTANPR